MKKELYPLQVYCNVSEIREWCFLLTTKMEFESKNLPSVCLRQEDHHQKRHTDLVARTVDSGARLSGVMSQLQPAVAM